MVLPLVALLIIDVLPPTLQVLWTNYLSPDYALFVSLAILQQEKEALHKEKNDFSDILSVSQTHHSSIHTQHHARDKTVVYTAC